MSEFFLFFFKKGIDKSIGPCYNNNVEGDKTKKEDENMLDTYITDITCEEFYGEDWDELMAELAEEEA